MRIGISITISIYSRPGINVLQPLVTRNSCAMRPQNSHRLGSQQSDACYHNAIVSRRIRFHYYLAGASAATMINQVRPPQPHRRRRRSDNRNTSYTAMPTRDLWAPPPFAHETILKTHQRLCTMLCCYNFWICDSSQDAPLQCELVHCSLRNPLVGRAPLCAHALRL